MSRASRTDPGAASRRTDPLRRTRCSVGSVTPNPLGEALRLAQLADPGAVADVILKTVDGLGVSDVVVYLADFAQTTLEPMPDRRAHADVPQSETIAATLAGRAFADQQPVTAPRPDGARVWVPIVEGSDRTGVLALTVAAATDEVICTCEELGLFLGYLIATQARSTDLYNLRRRRRSLSLGASMQWDLLPPLVLKTDRVTVAGLLEPAYEVGGDCFDYALNGSVLDVAVFDPVGHGVSSALIAALCVGSYRHDRREGQTLEQIHEHLERTMSAQFPDLFSTGVLAQLDIDTGALAWTNAGHPLPMLIRGGKVVAELQGATALPWGLGSLTRTGGGPPVATESLEPGDGVLFYTDGVIEAHLPGGEQFGADRLADLVGQHASDQLEPEEIVRRLVGTIVAQQQESLSDDATLLLLQWQGPR